MRPLGHPLAPLLAPILCLGLAGCGSGAERAADSGHEPEEHGSATSSPSGSASAPAPSETSAAPAVPEEGTAGGEARVVLVSESAARGQTTDVAVPLPDATAVAQFAGQFDGRLAQEVTAAADRLGQPADARLYGQVVAIGCDVPPEASVERRGDAVVLRPEQVKSSPVQCLVPVTTVALALVTG